MAFDMILSSDSAVVCLHLCVLREDIHFVRVFYKERLWIYSVMQSDGNSFYGDVEFLVLISFFLFIISIRGILILAHRKNLVQANVHCTMKINIIYKDHI